MQHKRCAWCGWYIFRTAIRGPNNGAMPGGLYHRPCLKSACLSVYTRDDPRGAAAIARGPRPLYRMRFDGAASYPTRTELNAGAPGFGR